jgi:hypothetical protein
MSRWSEYKEKNGVTPLDMLNPATKYTTEDVAKSRIDICKTCPEFVKASSQCKKCGCFMSMKTKMEMAKCPIGKW